MFADALYGLTVVLALLLASEIGGDRCVTSNLKPGRCVVLATCPLLKQIIDKPFFSVHDQRLLIAAANACPEDQYCCESVAKAKVPMPAVGVRQFSDEREDASDVCLQSRLGTAEDFVGASSLTSSFGVFVAIGPLKDSRCVGSLITAEFVLTAAHCVLTDRLTLYIGATHVLRDVETGLEGDVEARSVSEIFVHEQYSRAERRHDIALLRLNASVPQDHRDAPRPICIPMGPDHDGVGSVGQTLRCFGWGLNADGVPSEAKQWVTLERISLAECQGRMDAVLRRVRRVQLTERNICTTTITGHDAFAGYSGGPLMYQTDGTWHLVGIVSYGVGETSNEFPVVSINVQQYTDWILGKIRPDP